MFNTLLTFKQRRLIAHQVDTSYLLWPAKAEEPGAKTSEGEENSSEEELEFIKDNDLLDDRTKSLLIGIIQAAPPERKGRKREVYILATNPRISQDNGEEMSVKLSDR